MLSITTKLCVILVILLGVETISREASTVITFPSSFTGWEFKKIDTTEKKNFYKEGINAVQSIAGLVQNMLLQETVNFAAKNWIISPVSLAGVFAQLLMASRGKIREVLSYALSLDEEYEKNHSKLDIHKQLGGLIGYYHHPGDNDYILLMNSVVFLQPEFPLKPSYRHALWDFYRTPILPVDFTGRLSNPTNIINEWVKNATKNRFSDLMTLPLSPNIVSLMANIVYFKGTWDMPFDPDYTQSGLFYVNQTEKIHVDYMHGEQEILYGNTSDYQLIGLPFKSKEIVMYILLPNGKFSTKVAMKQFNSMASSAKLENVTLVLPKVKLTTTFSIKDAITKYLKGKVPDKKIDRGFLSLNELKSRSASRLPPQNQSDFFDMGGASVDTRFKIDDILHKVSMQMDELGTELIAATSTLVDHVGNDFILKVNRPFLFFIRHEQTEAHLFWGCVVNPNKP